MSIPFNLRDNCIYSSFANVTAHNDKGWFHINHYCLTCLKTFIQKKSFSQKNSNFEASMRSYEYCIAPMTNTTYAEYKRKCVA